MDPLNPTSFNQAAIAPPQQQPSGKSGGPNWLSLIPSGLAAAASFIPGVGSIGAGLLGAGGELGRELINGEGPNVGSILGQGALSAIPGGALLKGGEDIAKLVEPAAATAETAAKAAPVAENAAANAGTGLLGKVAPAAPAANVAPDIQSLISSAQNGNKIGNFLTNKGTSIEANAGGFGVGEKVGGNTLGFNDASQISKTLADNKIGAGSAATRQQAVEQKLGTVGQQIDSLISKNNAPLTDAQKSTVTDDFLKSISSQPGVDPNVMKEAQNLADNFTNQVNDTKGIIDFRRGMDNQVINFNANPDSAMAAKQLAATTFRDTLNSHANNLVPGISDANTNYSNLLSANEALKEGAGANQSAMAGSGITGRVLSSGAAQGAESVAGKALQTVGNVANNPVTGLLANVGGAKMALPIAQTVGEGQSTQDSQPANGASPPSGSLTDIVKGALQEHDTALNGPNTTPNGMPNADQLRSGLSAAMLQALSKGDVKGVATIKSVMDTLAPASATSTALTTQQKNGLVSERKALDVIQQYASLMDKAGGAQGPLAGNVEALLGNTGLVGGQPATVAAMSSQKADLTSAVASALSATGRANVVTLKQLEDSVPSITDSSAVASAKMNFLVNLMSSGTRAVTSTLPGISASLNGGAVPQNTTTNNIGSAMAGG